MADLGLYPSLQDFIDAHRAQQPVPVAPRGMVTPQPSGNGNLVSSALGSGFHSSLADIAQGVQAVATAVGDKQTAGNAAQFAAQHRATAATYETPENESAPLYTPRGLAYRVLQGLPMAGAGLAAAAGGEFLAGGAGAALAGGLFGLPAAVGGNVDRYETENGPLTPGAATKAIGLGIPEAAIGAVPLGRLVNRTAEGATSSIAREAARQAAEQAVASAGQDVIAQQMGDPDRTIYQRAQEVINSALTGGATGAIMGAGLRAIGKMRPSQIQDTDIAKAVDDQLGGVQPQAPVPSPPPPPAITDQRPGMTVTEPPTGGEQTEMPVTTEQSGLVSRPLQQMPGPRLVELYDQLNAQNPGDPRLQMIHNEVVLRLRESGAEPPQQPLPLPTPEPPAQGEMQFAPPAGQTDLFRAGPEAPAEPFKMPDEAASPAPIIEPAPSLREQLRRAQATETQEPAPGSDRASPPLEAIKQSMQPRWKAAEALREQTQDPETVKAIDDVQTRLLAPKSGGEVRSIDSAIGSIKDAIAGEQAKGDLAAARGEEPTPPAPAPPEQPKVAPAPANPPAAIAQLQNAVRDAKQSIVQMSKMRAPDTGSDVHDAHVQSAWDAGVRQQAAKLKAVDDALKTGNNAALAALPDNHFVNDDLWNNDKLSDQQKAALDTHANLEENVLDRARAAFPRMAGSVSASFDTPLPPTSNPHDIDIHNIIQNGGSTRDVYQHIARNGSNGLYKTVARLLLDNGENPDVEFHASQPVNQRAINQREGEILNGAYDPDANKIHLFRTTNLEPLMLHEGIHAATVRAIDSGTPAGRAFEKLYQTAKLRSGGVDLPGFRNAKEFAAEAFTNPHFQDWLNALPAETGPKQGRLGSLWQAFKNAVGRVFGASGAKQTMLDRVLDIGQQVMDENRTAEMPPLDTPQGAEARVSGSLHKMEEIKPAVTQELLDEAQGKLTNLTTAARSLGNGWTGARDLSRIWGRFSQGMLDWVQHTDRKTLLNEINSKVGAVAHAKNRALSKAEAKAVGEVVTGTHIGLNAAKTWGEVIRDNPTLDTPELAKEHRRLAAIYANLSPAARDAYLTAVATNEGRLHQNYTTQLYNMIRGAYGDKIAAPADPSETHRFEASLHDNAVANRDFWANAFNDLRKRAQPYIDEQTGLASQRHDPALRENVEPLKSLLDDYDSNVEQMGQVPNFHMGREGGFFASGHLPLIDEGKPDPRAIAELQNALNAKGFGHIELSQHLDNPTVYARVETAGDSERLRKIFDEHLSKTANGAAEDLVTNRGVMPLWREKMVGLMQAQLDGLGEDADAPTKAMLAQRVADMKREFLSSLPDSSVNKIMARRRGVQGFSGEWAQNFKQRDNNTSRMIANMAAMPHIAASALQMRKDVQAMNGRNDVTIGQKVGLAQAAQELVRREIGAPMSQPASFISATNSLTHTIELGMSIPYTMMLMSQNATLTLPRLGAEEGFLRAAQAMGRQTAKSLLVMKGALGGQDWATFGLRESELIKAGFSQADVDFLMHQQAMGTFNHGGYTNAMTSHHADAEGKLNDLRRMANATALYSEMQPRVLAALAARDLFADSKKTRTGDVHDFAHRMVIDSQLPWDALSTPRQLTSAGIAGQLSPLMNKFMGYQVRVTGLLLRELHNAFGREGPEQAAVARKFLLGHLAAVTVLAGTLGSPMVGVAASVYDRLADWATGKDDWDVTASYRNFLADMFGSKQVGEVIARGVPRLFGVDFSHMGDEKLLPGSSAALFLTEKRKLEDAEKDWLKSEAGAPAGMLADFIFGARDLANGDYLRGAEKMVPETFRGPVEAAQLALYSYRGKGGVKLPITANARDIALTAMGLDPQKEAEYNEAQKTVSGESTLAQLRESNITQHLAQSLQRGDMNTFHYWLDQSKDYQQDHPGMRPPVMELQRYMAQNMRQAAFASAMGLPLGAKPRNVTGRGMVGFANLQQ